MAAALECAAAGIDYEIIDRNDEVGGTWYTTVYPGIGVDTPSAYYSLSRDINGDWTSYYPQGAEYQRLPGVGGRQELPARPHPVQHRGRGAVAGTSSARMWEIHTRAADGTRGVSATPTW